MSDNNRINEYINIDLNLVKKIFHSYNPDILVHKFTLIPEGLSTSNYIVETESEGKYLLKVYPPHGVNFSREMASFEYAQTLMNVPKVLFKDSSKKILESSYLIMEYISGKNLNKYLKDNNHLPDNISYEIGKNLALLHSKKYKDMALLDDKLLPSKILIPITSLHKHLLNSKAGSHINPNTKNRLLNFINLNENWIEQLDSNYSFSHGDISLSNILIDNDENVWFIDFEYSLSAPIYFDIGKFLRNYKLLDSSGGTNIYDNLIKGYKEYSTLNISKDWFKLSKFIDISTMLQLINRDTVPKEWVYEIDKDINYTLNILNNELN